MATAPYHLWIECVAISAAARTLGTTVTITTVTAHGIVPGCVIQIGDVTGSIGTTFHGVFTILTTPSSTTLTYASSGTNGTGTVVNTRSSTESPYTAFMSQDLFNPLSNYSSTYRPYALYVPTNSVNMSSSGDGNGSTMHFTVMQDDTPSDGPWFITLPDEARVRMVNKTTGAAPASDESDVMFLGMVDKISARTSGSGLGTESQVDLVDNNAVLDRLAVFGTPLSSATINVISATNVEIVRASNVVTVTTDEDHGYSAGASATQVRISNVMGGVDTSFNGDFTVATVPNSYQFTFAQTGAAATGTGQRAVANTATGVIRATATSVNKIRVTTSAFHGIISGQAIETYGYVNTAAPGGAFENKINAVFTGVAVKKISTTVLELTLSGSPTNWHGMTNLSKGSSNLTDMYIKRPNGISPTVTPKDGQSQMTVGVNGDVSEDAAVQQMLGMVNRYKSKDAPVQRMIKTNTTTKIVGGTKNNTIGISFPSGTLRAALDSILEAYSGQDGKLRRYNMDVKRQLNYKLIDSTTAPSVSDAPYQIITSGVASPNTTTASATIYPTELAVDWDFHTTKQVLVSTSSQGINSHTYSRVVSYVKAGYTARPLAPVFDDILDAPTKAAKVDAEMTRLSTAYFMERSKPILSGSFKLVGYGTQSFNQYGFISGYKSSGNLVQSWQPGQWCSITCAELSLAGLYRIEQVDFSFVEGSYFAEIRITFNRRPLSNLTSLLNNRGV